MDVFKLKSSFSLTKDQKRATDELLKGLSLGFKEQTLLGVTGSGKTFTMANVIAKYNKELLF